MTPDPAHIANVTAPRSSPPFVTMFRIAQPQKKGLTVRLNTLMGVEAVGRAAEGRGKGHNQTFFISILTQKTAVGTTLAFRKGNAHGNAPKIAAASAYHAATTQRGARVSRSLVFPSPISAMGEIEE
jgi:hypothetical protein